MKKKRIVTYTDSQGRRGIWIKISDEYTDREKWSGKNCKIRRKAVLDYRNTNDNVGRHIQDFSSVDIKVKKGVHINKPVDYEDTVALVVGASSAQLREAAPHVENACVFLVGCGTNAWKAEKLSENSLSAYNPEILDSLIKNRELIAAVFRVWWEAEDEENWAENIVKKAEEYFEKPDSNYVEVTIDPQKLRERIQYYVLLSFFDEIEQHGWVTSEKLELYRQGAKTVFDPEPVEKKAIRRMEDPEVFLEIIRKITEDKNNKILQKTDRYVKKDKPIGAYREIREEKHFVMLEEVFKKKYAEYAKALCKADGIDTSFLQNKNWEKDLQAILSKAGVIKKASSGYRHRYNLLENGTRDKTYVVAIPCNLIENDMAKSTATSILLEQTDLPASLPEQNL